MISLAGFQPASKNQAFFHTERYFSDKVHAINEEVAVQTTLYDSASFHRLTSLIARLLPNGRPGAWGA